jgi:hypothetical protein
VSGANADDLKMPQHPHSRHWPAQVLLRLLVLLPDIFHSERSVTPPDAEFINTTLGLGGIFDVADRRFGVPVHYEDFGQTLATFGIHEGPFLFLPILGPSNLRDLAGMGVDTAAQPLTWFGQGLAVNVLSGVRGGAVVLDNRDYYFDVIDDMNRTSLDPYAALRNARRQARVVVPPGAACGRNLHVVKRDLLVGERVELELEAEPGGVVRCLREGVNQPGQRQTRRKSSGISIQLGSRIYADALSNLGYKLIRTWTLDQGDRAGREYLIFELV